MATRRLPVQRKKSETKVKSNLWQRSWILLLLECSKMSRSEGWLVYFAVHIIWLDSYHLFKMDPERHLHVEWFSVADLPMPGFHNVFWNCKCPQRRLGIEHPNERHNIGPKRLDFFSSDLFLRELNRFNKVEKNTFIPALDTYVL